MTEDVALATAVDSQSKNFRASYYDSLVFRGEEEKNIGSLESLLKAEIIGKVPCNFGCSLLLFGCGFRY